MTYLAYINQQLKERCAKKPLVLFGQNITRGSCLGGFTRGVLAGPGGREINSTNAESSLVGVGFGMLLEGQPSVFFMKQMDFLLLGIDQLVNTYNNIRSTKPKNTGSFTIMPITVDSGYQGPQSSLNALADFCSIANLRGYTLTNQWDTDHILEKHLMAPGVRLITVSQRQFKDELLPLQKPLYIAGNDSVFQYTEGGDATIVAFNFALPQAYRLEQELRKAGLTAALFNVNSPTDYEKEKIIESANRTGKIVILDDSKTTNLPHHRLLADPLLSVEFRLVLARELGENWLYPVEDLLDVQYEKVLEMLRNARAR